MITRRNFLLGASALALSPAFSRVADHYARTQEPLMLRPERVERLFYIHPEPQGLRLVTDAVEFPRAIVHPNALDAKFGDGSYTRLTQRDHWRLIEEGHFSEEETYIPNVTTSALDIWLANYSPHAEAFHLLHEYGLGPEGTQAAGSGLTFYEYSEEAPGVGFGVFADDWLAVSLLQAKFVELGIPVRILRQQRGWIKFLQNRVLGVAVAPSNYFGPPPERRKYSTPGWGRAARRRA